VISGRGQALIIHHIMNLMGTDGNQMVSLCNAKFCSNTLREDMIYT
jgi:hypothetical protein